MMYIPSHFEARESDLRELLHQNGAADLITATPEGLMASFLPFIYDPSVGGDFGSLLGHLARPNKQWQTPTQAEAVVVIHGPDAYVSPSWYPSKAEHGRVVPTWNYLTAHVYGQLVIHDDPAWVEVLVRRLTDKHEANRPDPWPVDDAPPSFVQAQLRAIVGVEIVISRIEGKSKWSQNRPPSDVEGVIEGLEADGQTSAAAAMRTIHHDY